MALKAQQIYIGCIKSKLRVCAFTFDVRKIRHVKLPKMLLTVDAEVFTLFPYLKKHQKLTSGLAWLTGYSCTL